MNIAKPLACLMLAGLVHPAHAVLPGNAEAEAILRKQLIDTRLVQGAALALVDAGGIRIVAVGEAREGSTLEPDSLFEIGSVTKTFTGLLLAIADERGEVKLDDAVEKHLPDGLKLRDSKGEVVRLVDLATHRSGLPRLTTNMQPKNPRDPYADYTEQDLLDFVKMFTPTRPRNEKYEYSNAGFGLLGYVLMRVARAESFEALVQARIFAPLGMASSTTQAGRFGDRTVQPHDSGGRPTPVWSMSNAYAAAGAVRSTAGDMGRYVELMAGIKPSPLDKAAAFATTMREEGMGRINPIGLAWTGVPFHERQLFNHDGATFGSSSSLFVDRDAKEGVFLVTNGSTRLFDISLHLLDRRHVLAPRQFPKTVAVAADKLATYVGRYRINDNMQITVRSTGDKLTAQATGQGEFEIFAESDTRFFAKVAPIVMTFGDVKDGRAGHFVLEQSGAKLMVRRID